MQSFWMFVLVLTFGCRSFRCEESPPVTPEQTTCKDLKAIPKLPPNPNEPAAAVDFKAWVIRIYQDPASPPTEPINCGPYGWIFNAKISETSPDCGSARTQVIFDGTSPTPVVKSAALNTKTGDVDLYEEHLEMMEEGFYIWKATLKTMKVYSAADATIKDIETIPPALQLERDVGVALIDAGPDRTWVLYGVCNKQTAWIAVSDNVITEQKLDDAMNAQIDAAITKAGFDPKAFRSLEARLPEGVSAFIPLV